MLAGLGEPHAHAEPAEPGADDRDLELPLLGHRRGPTIACSAATRSSRATAPLGVAPSVHRNPCSMPS